MYAFKNDLLFTEVNLNDLLSPQSFSLIYSGGATQDSYEGTGAAAYSLADHNYIAQIVDWDIFDVLAWASAGNKGRLELKLDKDYQGADLTVQIRDSAFNPDGSSAGALVKEIVIPKEFLPASAEWYSIPLDFTLGMDYWILCKKAGDGWNKVKWTGDAAANPAQPAYYRTGDSGAWTEAAALTYRIILNGDEKLLHELAGTNGLATYKYAGDLLTKGYFYLPSGLNLLSVNQAGCCEDGSTTGFSGWSVTIEADSATVNSGRYSLKNTTVGGSSDTYVSVGGDWGALRLGMEAGKTYKFTGKIYVPNATGLTPDDATWHGILKIIAIYTGGSALSAAAAAVDTWEELSVTFTVPAGAAEAYVRLYNGFLAAGKIVYWDDLRLLEETDNEGIREIRTFDFTGGQFLSMT